MIRYTGHGDATLARWLNRMGKHSAGLHNVFFRNLVIALVQFDELYARVRTVENTRWLLDPVSKPYQRCTWVDGPVQTPTQSYMISKHDLHPSMFRRQPAMDCGPTFMR